MSGKTAYAYCRDSGGPAQEQSIGQQQQALQQFADATGYVIGGWYLDAARSGRSDDRAEFQRLIADALREKPAAVLVWDMARFARDQVDAAYYRGLLRRAGVNVVSINDQIPDGPLAHIVESVIDFSSEHYSKTLGQNIKRGHLAALAQGYIPGARPPVGYREVREEAGRKRTGETRYRVRWVIDADIAPLVRQAFEMRARGSGVKTIMRATGLHKTRQGLHALLHNPTYKGLYRYGGQEWPGVVPPIVDAATWDAAQRDFDLHPRTAAADYILTGILRCGFCGQAMSGFASARTFKNGRRWRRRYYVCAQRTTHIDGCRAPLVRADDLEADVFELVLESFLAPEPFARFVAAARQNTEVDAHAARAAQLDGQIAAGETALRGMVDLLGQGVAVEAVAEKLRAQEAALRELRQARARLVTPEPLLLAAEDELRAFVERLRDRLITGSIEEQRAVLREVVARISYGPELIIEYRLPPR